ncbi:MAG: lasso peptide biosynthesis B2 protein [Janthinobacterium lividum]
MRRVIFHAEVLAALALASVLIALLSFRRLATLMAQARATTPVDAGTARRIDRALGRWSARVPWRSMCFQQGVAAQMLLRRRGREATVHYGAARDGAGNLVAHVWVRSGDVDVTGCVDVGRYGLLATFPPSR